MEYIIKVVSHESEDICKTYETAYDIIEMYRYFTNHIKYTNRNTIIVKFDNYSVMCELIEMITANRYRSRYDYYALYKAYQYLIPVYPFYNVCHIAKIHQYELKPLIREMNKLDCYLFLDYIKDNINSFVSGFFIPTNLHDSNSIEEMILEEINYLVTKKLKTYTIKLETKIIQCLLNERQYKFLEKYISSNNIIYEHVKYVDLPDISCLKEIPTLLCLLMQASEYEEYTKILLDFAIENNLLKDRDNIYNSNCKSLIFDTLLKSKKYLLLQNTISNHFIYPRLEFVLSRDEINILAVEYTLLFETILNNIKNYSILLDLISKIDVNIKIQSINCFQLLFSVEQDLDNNLDLLVQKNLINLSNLKIYRLINSYDFSDKIMFKVLLNNPTNYCSVYYSNFFKTPSSWTIFEEMNISIDDKLARTICDLLNQRRMYNRLFFDSVLRHLKFDTMSKIMYIDFKDFTLDTSNRMQFIEYLINNKDFFIYYPLSFLSNLSLKNICSRVDKTISVINSFYASCGYLVKNTNNFIEKEIDLETTKLTNSKAMILHKNNKIYLNDLGYITSRLPELKMCAKLSFDNTSLIIGSDGINDEIFLHYNNSIYRYDITQYALPIISGSNFLLEFMKDM